MTALGVVITTVAMWFLYGVFCVVPSSAFCKVVHENPPWVILSALATVPAVLVTWYWRATHRIRELDIAKDQADSQARQVLLNERQTVLNERQAEINILQAQTSQQQAEWAERQARAAEKQADAVEEQKNLEKGKTFDPKVYGGR